MTQPEDVLRLRELARAATPGPWALDPWLATPKRKSTASVCIVGDSEVRSTGAAARGHTASDKDDGDYIAALSPDVLTGLLDRLERWAGWIVATSAVNEPDSTLVYDWACAQCTVRQTDPPTVPGFVCVPHEAQALFQPHSAEDEVK